MEVELQPIINRVHDGHSLHGGVAGGGQLPAGRADQLDGQQLEDGLCQLLADAAPCPTTKGDVVKAACGLCPGSTEAVWVKAAVGALVNSGRLMRVTDAVHDTPAFGDLVTLGGGEKRGREECYIPVPLAVLVEDEQRVLGISPTILPICSTAPFLPSPTGNHGGCWVAPSPELHCQAPPLCQTQGACRQWQAAAP